MTGSNLTSPTANTHVVSLQARSTPDLTQAIHLPGDDGFTVERARLCLSLYYEKDMMPQDRADMLDLFSKALHHLPKWAVAKGFDTWERSGIRRPSPGEIVLFAQNAIKEITDELARRRRLDQERAVADDATREASRVTPEARARIMAEVGMTPVRLAAVEAGK